MSCHVKPSPVRSRQVKSSSVHSSQFKPSQAKSSQVQQNKSQGLVTPVDLPAGSWPDAAHQKQLLESVYAMIDELEREKRTSIASADTKQVRNYHDTAYGSAEYTCLDD